MAERSSAQKRSEKRHRSRSEGANFADIVRTASSSTTSSSSSRPARRRIRKTFGDDFITDGSSVCEEVPEVPPAELMNVVSESDLVDEEDAGDVVPNKVVGSSNPAEPGNASDLSGIWSAKSTFDQRQPCLAGEWRNRLHSSVGRQSSERREVDLYLLFRPDADRQLEVNAINVYVTLLRCSAERPPYVSTSVPWPPLWTTKFDDLTLAEYTVFEGLILATGLVSYPSYRDFFSARWPFQSPFANLMARDRFEAIKAALILYTSCRDQPTRVLCTKWNACWTDCAPDAC